MDPYCHVIYRRILRDTNRASESIPEIIKAQSMAAESYWYDDSSGHRICLGNNSKCKFGVGFMGLCRNAWQFIWANMFALFSTMVFNDTIWDMAK